MTFQTGHSPWPNLLEPVRAGKPQTRNQWCSAVIQHRSKGNFSAWEGLDRSLPPVRACIQWSLCSEIIVCATPMRSGLRSVFTNACRRMVPWYGGRLWRADPRSVHEAPTHSNSLKPDACILSFGASTGVSGGQGHANRTLRVYVINCDAPDILPDS